jgi:hypothetical protein
MRAVLSAVLRTRVARVLSLTAAAVVAAQCHSEPTNVCTPTNLVFTAQPASVAAGTGISLTVEARDNSGTLATCFTGNVTVAIGTNPGGGTLSGTTTVAASSGVASFSGLTITKAGAGYTLTVNGVGVATAATSSAFTITAGPATALAFTTQPANANAGASITAIVTARDNFGNTAASFTGNLTMTIGTNPGSGTLGGTATVTAIAGVATFSTLTINKVGVGYTLIATPAGGAPPAAVISSAFNINPGPVAKLAFTAQPSNTAAGVSIAPTIQVTAQDANGNTTPTYTGTVTVALAANPGSGTLTGTLAVAAVSGVASFTDLKVNKPAAGYTLSGSATGLTTATSTAFTISLGPLAQLIFSAQPASTVAGVAVTPAVTVTGQDAAGNTVTTFTGNVTVGIGTNPSSGTLSGSLTKAAVAGVATFNDLSIDKAGTGYTLTATSGGASQATSNAFAITPAAAAKLSFTVQPANTAAGTAITPAVEVKALDLFDNVATAFTGNVTVAIGTNANAGTLSGTTTIAAAAGIATFSTLSIDSAGTGYTLTATAAALTNATSSTFNIVPGTATHLVFTQQPTNAAAGVAITPAVKVTALDAQGNVATAYTANVTVAIGTNPGSGTLSGTATVAAAAGVATFSGLSINKSGTGYTLTTSSGALTGATSASFNIVAAAATHLVITTQPVNTGAGASITPAVVVAAQDAFGNTNLTYTANVVVAIGTNPSSGTLSGTLTRAAVAGVATFNDLSINLVGTGYTLGASSGALTAATSNAFNIFANTATHLIFSVQPGNTVAGVTIAPAVVVQALDGSNNIASGFTGGITIAFGNNAGGGTLSGTTVVTATAGVASFSTLSINKTGDGYTLTVTAGGVTSATTNGFKITPAAATHLAFGQAPTSTTAGASITPAVTVRALDAFDNLDTAYTANVDLAIGTNPGGGTLSGTTPVAATNGTATFSNLSINKSGTGYTLHATSGTLTDVNSGTFDISSGTLAQLVFTQQPTNTSAGVTITPNVLVAGQDALGNTVTSFTGTVTVVIGTNPGTGTLSGTTSVSAITGVATFSNLSIDKAGSGYSLTASATGASDGTSTSFDIAAGAATILTFTAQPASSTTAGTSIAPPLTVAAQDAQGNTDPNFIGNITVAIGTNGGTPTPGTLAGTTTIAATAGVATFSNLSIDKSGTGYTLAASSGALTPATSNSFAITAGTATKLTFTVEPVTTTAGIAIPAISVSAQDALGNTNASYTASVSVAITGGTGKAGAALSGTASHAAVSGVAGFSGLSIDSAGTGYTLTATSGSLTDGVSASFDINAGAVTQLLFTVQPTNVAAGATITPNVALVAKDAIGNVNTGYTSTITLTLPVNPGGAAVSNGSVSAVGGTVMFGNLFLDKVGTGYRLQATDGSVTSLQSSTFNVTPGAVDHLAFTVQPTNATSNANISPAVKVTAQDVFNNTVTSFANNITVAIGNNPVGGTLAGTRTRAAIAGVAAFGTLGIDAVNDSINDGSYTLAATSGALPTATSNTFNIIPSVATRLFFKVQPPNTTTAGATMATFSVEARDASGQVVTGYGDNVTLTITSNTGAPGASLGGTVTQAAVTGTATFNDITIDKTAADYKLTASATGVTGAVSAFFKIDPDVPDKLVFSVQPSNATALSPITPQIEAMAIDQFGNVVTGFTDNVTLAISDANASGGTLSGVATKAAVGGVATFAGMSIDIAQTGHTLDASTATAFATSNTVTSNSFDITASTVNHLVITAQPTATTAGQTISTITVEAQDASNALLTGFSGQVTATITAATGTTGATLGGTTTVTASGGIASFTDLNIDKKGTGYRLSFTASGLSGVTSNTFVINVGPASQVAFIVDPVDAGAGVAITPTMQVEVEDALGNRVTGFAGTVSISIFANPGGGTLSGSSTATVGNGQLVAGVASFSDLSIDAVGVGYRLQATSSGLASDVSTAFQVAAGAADHLVFTVAPSDRIAGQGITPAIRVTAFDALGNVATSFGDDITLAITSGTGTLGAVLSGTTTVTAGSGVAIFSGLSIDKAGTGYTLSATTPASGVTGTTSATFTITPSTANHLVFTVQPSNTAANASITPAVEVSVRDAFENTVTTFVGNVTVAIGTDAGGGGTVLSGTKIKAVLNGVATFNDLSLNKTGTGFTLTAQSGAFPLPVSAAFNIF